MLYNVPGYGVLDDQTQTIPEYGELRLPNGETITWGVQGITPVGNYGNVAQYGDQRFQWDPTAQVMSGQMQETSPGYVTDLLGLRERVRTGQAQPWEAEQYQRWEEQARSIPTRDIASLTAGWQGEREGEHANQDWWTRLDPGSPDVGPIMLGIQDRMQAGTATPQERQLFQQVSQMAGDWNYRASVPQASDANPFGMGDQFMQALTMLSLAVGGAGSFGAFAPAAAAGGATAAASPTLLGVPTSTLATLGQVGTYGGMGANILGAATDQPWLRTLGTGLSVGGGLAGGLAGLGNVLNTGVNSLGDAARLASSASRITGSLGTATGVDALRDASRYLGWAGQVGRVGSGVQGLLGAAQEASSPVGQTPQALTLAAPDLATQRGGGGMEWDYSNDWGATYDPGYYYAGGSPTFDESGGGYSVPIGPGLGWDSSSNPAWQQFTGWGDPTGVGSSGDTNWLSTLGSLGTAALGFLGRNSGALGPLLSGAGGIASGALGANASNEAARLQAAALNRGLDLQTAQWLQQQANQAPWLQAGQQALAHLTGRSTWDQPTLSQVGPLSPAAYNQALPTPTPGWQPQTYAGYTPTDTPSAAGYRYTPGQGPSAAQYRYTPGQTPDAAAYRYTPGAVPTLSGAELLANDPGVQFRLDEGRRALEASAAARGGLTSGATLAALQRQGQELSSQEYANAWNRAAQQAQMREGWAQQAGQQNFGQAMSAAQLREQVNQIASQQGWSQAQAEAAFREQLAQQAGAQNWSQALQEAQARAQQQQFGWQSGFQAQQQGQRERQAYDTDLYGRQLQMNQLQYGRDTAFTEAQNQRMMDAYNAQRQGQNTAWNQFASLAGLGQTALGQLGSYGTYNNAQMNSLLGQLGSAQGLGTLGSAANWNQAIAGGVGGLQNLLRGLNT